MDISNLFFIFFSKFSKLNLVEINIDSTHSVYVKLEYYSRAKSGNSDRVVIRTFPPTTVLPHRSYVYPHIH